MAQMSSGKILKETRERKGYDLTTVARRLRIRPDILRAIEAGDFSSMPPKGYTRNMVNAYARLLGLNPTEIVNMYLDEVYAHQVEKARGSGPNSGFVMDPENKRTRLRGLRGSTDRTGQTEDRSTFGATEEIGRTGRMTRHLYDDRTQYSRDDYGVSRNQAEGTRSTDRDFMSHHSGYATSNRNFINDSNSSRRKGNRDIRVGQTPMEYKPSRLPSVFQSRLAMGIAIAAVVVLIFVLVFFVFFKQDQSNAEDVSQLPVSGITDTTGDKESESAGSVEITPTSAHVAFSAKSGSQCYVETYLDGKIDNNYTLESGEEKTVDVTGKWTIATWDRDALQVTVQGEEVTLETSDEYGGMFAYTLDFNTWLNDWLAEHGSSAAKRQAAVAIAATAASEATQSNSSSSASAQSGNEQLTQQSDEGSYDEQLTQQSGEGLYDEQDYAYDYYYGTLYDESGYYDESYAYGYYDESGNYIQDLY